MTSRFEDKNHLEEERDSHQTISPIQARQPRTRKGVLRKFRLFKEDLLVEDLSLKYKKLMAMLEKRKVMSH